jgi:hypothetical protein
MVGKISLLLVHCILMGSVYATSQEEARQPQKIVRHTDHSQSLTTRYDWARKDMHQPFHSTGCWIGYSIRKLMGKRSFVGSYHSLPSENRPSLAKIVGDSMNTNDTIPSENTFGNDFSKIRGQISFDDEEKPHNMVLKEIGILFWYDERKELREVTVSNLSLHVDLESNPLIWLGFAENDESVRLLKSLFSETKDPKVKEKIVTAVGIHEPTENSFEFLKNVLYGSDAETIRSEAVFWLGENHSPSALHILTDIIRDDPSSTIRENALFAISQLNDTRATDVLIKLAQNAPDRKVRQDAMFWIGQKASVKAVAALETIVTGNEDDLEVKKSAVFALGQLPDNQGIDPLIRIAQTHRDPRVRKEAIFLLGQINDERALDVLIKLILN